MFACVIYSQRRYTYLLRSCVFFENFQDVDDGWLYEIFGHRMCNLLARHLPRNVERSEGQVFLQYDGRIRRRRQSPTSDPALQRFEVVQLCSNTKRHNFIIIIFNIIFSIRLTFIFECWVLRAQMTEKLALLQGFVRQHLGTDHTLCLRFTAADDFRKPEAEECFFICALRHYTATRLERTDSLTQCVHADSAAVISSCSDSVAVIAWSSQPITSPLSQPITDRQD